VTTWTMPNEPGFEVSHVRDRFKVVWRRADDGFWWGDMGHGYEKNKRWHELLPRGPLTDMTGEVAS